MIGSASIFDRMVLPTINISAVNSNTRAVTPRKITTPSGDKRIVIASAGQSNIANYVTGSYSLLNPSLVHNINVVDGGVYSAQEPLVGCGGTAGNWLLRLADKLIADDVADQVFLVPVAVGSTEVAEWQTTYLPLLQVALRRCAALGVPADAVLWQQGESDTLAGTNQATYQARLASIIAAVRAEGLDAPWLLGKSTYHGGTTSSAVRAAISALVSPGAGIFAGADTDVLTGTTYREPALVHFNATGANAVADLWKAALIAALD